MNGPKWVDDVEYTPCEMCGQYAANPDTGLCNGCEQQYNDWMEPKLAPNRLARKGEGNGNGRPAMNYLVVTPETTAESQALKREGWEFSHFTALGTRVWKRAR